MELTFKIVYGERRGRIFNLPILDNVTPTIKYLAYEDEAYEISLELLEEYDEINLNLYDLSYSYDEVIFRENRYTYIWYPRNKSAKLFLNYFGLAELSVQLGSTLTDNLQEIWFAPLEVLTTKSKAKNIHQMIHYISQKKPDEVLNHLRITKKNFGLSESEINIQQFLEKLEKLEKNFNIHLRHLESNKLSKLNSFQIISKYHDDIFLDDQSIQWINENPDCLYQVDTNQEDGLLQIDNSSWGIECVATTETTITTDIYENQIIHGFIEHVIYMIGEVRQNFVSIQLNQNMQNDETGYISYYDYINQYNHNILNTYFNKIIKIRNSFINFKRKVEKIIPVQRSIRNIPNLTQKIKGNYTYLNIFQLMIEWYKLGAVNWKLNDYLFALQNIAKLFEIYTLLKIKESLDKVIGCVPSSLSINDDTIQYVYSRSLGDIEFLYQPKYWKFGHIKNRLQELSNIEKWSIRGSKSTDNHLLSVRSSRGRYSHRSPDFSLVFRNVKLNTSKHYFIDSKYMKIENVFTYEMPKLVLKYLHGIKPVVDTASIIGLCLVNFADKQLIRHYEDDSFNLYSEYKNGPFITSLTLSENVEQDDDIEYFIQKVLLRLIS